MCECFKGGKNRSAIFQSRILRELTVVFGIRGLITVTSIVGIATSSISITTSSTVAAVTIRLPVVGIVVGLGYVLISRHDCFVFVTITRRVSSRGKIGRDTNVESKSASVYASKCCFGQICRQAVSYKVVVSDCVLSIRSVYNEWSVEWDEVR